MKTTRILILIFLILTFLLGLYVTVFHKVSFEKKEGFSSQKEGMETSSCPDMLVKKGNVLLLYNSNEPTRPENPIPFFNLDEYINYLEVQKEKGYDCPVLYLQEETNAQGEDVYRVRPSPFDLQGGLPAQSNISEETLKKAKKVMDASRDNSTYNVNHYAGFDAHGQHVGEYTDLDALHDSTKMKKISDNPMDSNWAGTTYTQQMVDSGKYEKREITKPYFFKPKTVFFPNTPSVVPPPKDIL